MEKQLHLTAIIGINSNGYPDIMWVKVRATQKAIDNCDYTKAAVEHAHRLGFECALVTVDEGCPLWETLIKPEQQIIDQMEPIEIA